MLKCEYFDCNTRARFKIVYDDYKVLSCGKHLDRMKRVFFIYLLVEAGDKRWRIFTGDFLFKMYDTYGFPIDLIRSSDPVKNLGFELDEIGFLRRMEEQKNRSRKCVC